jgi:hypothetical protein
MAAGERTAYLPVGSFYSKGLQGIKRKCRELVNRGLSTGNNSDEAEKQK